MPLVKQSECFRWKSIRKSVVKWVQTWRTNMRTYIVLTDNICPRRFSVAVKYLIDGTAYLRPLKKKTLKRKSTFEYFTHQENRLLRTVLYTQNRCWSCIHSNAISKCTRCAVQVLIDGGRTHTWKDFKSFVPHLLHFFYVCAFFLLCVVYAHSRNKTLPNNRPSHVCAFFIRVMFFSPIYNIYICTH